MDGKYKKNERPKNFPRLNLQFPPLQSKLEMTFFVNERLLCFTPPFLNYSTDETSQSTDDAVSCVTEGTLLQNGGKYGDVSAEHQIMKNAN